MDGSPNGRIKCSLDNWVGKVYLIPRTEITRSKNRPELAQTGIYLLFGTDIETGEEKLDYFTHAILIIDSDNSFGPTEISYLENAFYQQALIADRVRAVNGNDPSPGNVTEEKKAALDEFISMAKILIGSLGYRVFDAVDDAKTLARNPSETAPPSVEPLLFLNSAGASGSGRQTTDGFVVLAGAKLRAEMTHSVPESAHKNRERLAERISEDGELLRDTLFTSPSAASDFLTGSSTSGKVHWKTADGVTLRDLEAAELEATATGL